MVKLNLDLKVIILSVIAALLIIGGIFAAVHTETLKVLNYDIVSTRPFSNWAPPLIVGGIVVGSFALYIAMSKK